MKDSFKGGSILSEFFMITTRVSNVASRGICEVLKEGPDCKFELLQKIHILSHYYGNGEELAVSDIIQYTKLAPQAVSRMLRGLERDGLIVRIPDSGDHRKILVQITEEGESKRLVCQKLMIDYLEEVIKEFGEENMRKINELNVLLLDAFQRVEDKKKQK